MRPAALIKAGEGASIAIYHLSVKTISRSAGRSATAAAAYRAGSKIEDQRTGDIHDYTRKGGVESVDLVLPEDAPAWAADRASMWNAAEQAETRKNSTVAREFEIALPDELDPAERRRLALDFARELVQRHGVAADVAIHAPGKEGDHRNHHAHILLTTRRLGPDGFTQKTRELDDLKTGKELVSHWRERFADLQNARLQENSIEARVDHRSLADQGHDREPTRHLGPAASGYERRTGQPSRKRLDFEQEVSERLRLAKEAGELERQELAVDQSILDLSADLAAARAQRDRFDFMPGLIAEKQKEQEPEQERIDAARRAGLVDAVGLAKTVAPKLGRSLCAVIEKHETLSATADALAAGGNSGNAIAIGVAYLVNERYRGQTKDLQERLTNEAAVQIGREAVLRHQQKQQQQQRLQQQADQLRQDNARRRDERMKQERSKDKGKNRTGRNKGQGLGD